MRTIELNHEPCSETHAAAMARAGAPVPFCVRTLTADTFGLPGGKDRPTPPGGLWCTIVWPTSETGRHYAGVPLLAGVVLTRAIERLVDPSPRAAVIRLSWPDRLTAAGRTFARIRTRRLVLPDRPVGEQKLMLLHVDAMLDTTPRDAPSAFEGGSTSLRENGWDAVGHDNVAAILPDALGKALLNFEETGLSEADQALIESRLDGMGARVRFASRGKDQGVHTGRLVGVDHRAALVLDTPAGKLACRSGTLVIL